MDAKISGSSKIDAVLHDVTFYPRESSHAGSHVKAVSDVQMNAATHTVSRLGSRSFSVHKKTQKTIHQSERHIGARKSKILERQPKSIESFRITNSNCRLIRKPKYTLLPYKRGQLKFCPSSGNVVVRKGTHMTLNSEQAAEKENKIDCDNFGGNASNTVTEKLSTRAGTSRRFFKANFGTRRQFTVNVHGVTVSRVKLNCLKLHKRNTAVRNKQLCLSASSDCSKPESDTIAAEESRECELLTACNVDPTCEVSCEYVEHLNCESTEGNINSNLVASNTECTVTDDCDSTANVQQRSDITGTSATTSVVMSSSKLYSDNPATSLSFKHGLNLSSYGNRANKRKSEDAVHKATKKDKEQMLLDFGQKLHETVNCGVCGMTYIHCEPVDELTHSQYHQTVFATLKFTGWRKTAVVHDFDDGSRVVAISCDDKKNCRRVAEIKKLVDKELGYIVEGSLSSHYKTYLYISSTHVVGFCLAQHITRGYRLLSSDECESEENRSRTRSCCCSEEPVPARCGISRIWVLASERRKHVASRLLDVVRGNFLMGYPVAKEELAFSDPTPDGIKFATRYTGTSAFLVYKTAA